MTVEKSCTLIIFGQNPFLHNSNLQSCISKCGIASSRKTKLDTLV